jgi:uncharacterized protein (TIGR02145 family)
MVYFLNTKYILRCILIFVSILPFNNCKKEDKIVEKTYETGTVTDRQNNVYGTIKIGNQWWMSENLKVTVYNDSTPIFEVRPSEPDSIWANTNVGAFCNLDSRYGLHYNWFALGNSKKLAPVGWHIPSDEEWKLLEKEIGMSQTEVDNTSWRGTKVSEKLIPESSVGWPAFSLVFGTNESRFNGLPGGCRLFNGKKGEVSTTAFWWSASEKNSTAAWYRNLSSNNEKILRYYVDKNYGLTIRCVKN